MTVHGPWVAAAITQNLGGAVVKAMAVSSAHVPNPDTEFRSQITGELAGGGYVAGGVVVTGLTIAYDPALNRVLIDCALVNFGAVTAASVAGVIFYISTGLATTDRLLCTEMFASVAAAGALTYDPVVGIIEVTVS